LIIHFNGDKISSVAGDYDLSAEFNTPLDESSLPSVNEQDLKPLLPEVRPDAKPLVEELRPALKNQAENDNDNAPT
jgi:outer membrane protein assembly factor BamE